MTGYVGICPGCVGDGAEFCRCSEEGEAPSRRVNGGGGGNFRCCVGEFVGVQRCGEEESGVEGVLTTPPPPARLGVLLVVDVVDGPFTAPYFSV